MGNQHANNSNPQTYYSIEYLNGSSGFESMPEMTIQDYSSGSVGDQLSNRTESRNELNANSKNGTANNTSGNNTSTIKAIKSTATVQRSKSYVKPENRVLPCELPTKPLRKTNYLKSVDGYKKTWRNKGKNATKDQFVCSYDNFESFGYPFSSTPDNMNEPHRSDNNVYHSSGSISSEDWQVPTSLEALQNYKNNIRNEIKNFREKYSHSMDNLEEWTTEDFIEGHICKTPVSYLTKPGESKSDFESQSDKLKKDQFETKIPLSKSIFDNTSKSLDKKIKPIAPVLPMERKTSTPTNLVYEKELSLKKPLEKPEKSGGILLNTLKKSKKQRSKTTEIKTDFKKSVEFQVDKGKYSDYESSEKTQGSTSLKSSKETNKKKTEEYSKAKSFILQNRRQRLMEQSINESLDLEDPPKETSNKRSKKKKSKSFLHTEKFDTSKSKNGAMTVQRQKKNSANKLKGIDLEKDIQIISRFPINSKVYRHYIAGSSTCDKLANSYNVNNMLKNENKAHDQVNERPIDVTDSSISASKQDKDEIASSISPTCDENEQLTDKQFSFLYDTALSKNMDQIYDSIRDYNTYSKQISKYNESFINDKILKPVFNEVKPMKNGIEVYPTHQDCELNINSNTTTFKPITKIVVNSNNSTSDSSQDNNTDLTESSIVKNAIKNLNASLNPNNFQSVTRINVNVQNNNSNKEDLNSKFIPIQNNDHSPIKNKTFQKPNEPPTNNFYIKRKCSMSSEKLEPIQETAISNAYSENINPIENNNFPTRTTTINITTNPNTKSPFKSTYMNNNNNNNNHNNNTKNENFNKIQRITRKNTFEIHSQQRLNEKLQNEIQRAYEERTKRFNKVKMALRTNSNSSNYSNKPTLTCSSIELRINDEIHSISTNRILERQITNDIPLPSPPLLPPSNPCGLQYSVSSCSSVTLPPPPPPPPQIDMEINLNENLHNKHITSNNNNKIDIKIESNSSSNNNNNNNNHNNTRLLPAKNELIKKFNETLNNSHLISYSQSGANTNHNPSSSSSVSSTTSSLSSTTSTTGTTTTTSNNNYFKPISKDISKIEDCGYNSASLVDNLFSNCTQELMSMGQNLDGGKFEEMAMASGDGEDNFILKSKPIEINDNPLPHTSSSYQIGENNSLKDTENDYYGLQNPETQTKSSTKGRRKCLTEVFPEIKTAIKDAQAEISNEYQCSWIDEEKNDKNQPVEFSFENNKNTNNEVDFINDGINKFHIDDLEWTPASDLGDFEFDDYKNCAIDQANDDERPKKKTKHSSSFLAKNPEQKQLEINPNKFKSTIGLKSIGIKGLPFDPIKHEQHYNLSDNSCKSSIFNGKNKGKASCKWDQRIIESFYNSKGPIDSKKRDENENNYHQLNDHNENNNNNLDNNNNNNGSENRFEVRSQYLNKWIRRNGTTEHNSMSDNCIKSQEPNKKRLKKSSSIFEVRENGRNNNNYVKGHNNHHHKNSSSTTNVNNQENKDYYRTLIKMREDGDKTSSDEEYIKNAIKKQMWQKYIDRVNSMREKQQNLKSNSHLPNINTAKLNEIYSELNRIENEMFTTNTNGNNNNNNNNVDGKLYYQHRHIETNNTGCNETKVNYHQLKGHLVSTSNGCKDSKLADECSNALDALLYDTDRGKSSVGGGSTDGKRNPIYFSSDDDESVYGNLV